MGLAQQLLGGVVYIDSAPLIYFFEKKEGFFQQLNEFFKVCEKGEITLITSALTVSEVLTYPILIKKTKLIKEYENFFETSNSIRVFDIGIPEAKLSAELRALHNLKHQMHFILLRLWNVVPLIFLLMILNSKKFHL